MLFERKIRDFFFSGLQVFQVRKVLGAYTGKIFAMKVLKKVMSIIIQLFLSLS